MSVTVSESGEVVVSEQHCISVFSRDGKKSGNLDLKPPAKDRSIIPMVSPTLY